MKKLILPIIFFFTDLFIFFIFFIFVPTAYAVNLNGEWVTEKGARGELSQSGNTFSLVVTYSRFEKLIGITAVKGTITGDTFIGQIYTYNDECPNRNGLVPAKGTISEGKIEIEFTRHAYDSDTCVRIPNSDAEGSITYTRIITPSPTPQSKQSNPQPSSQFSEEGNPFNIFGINPLEIWRNIQKLLDITQGLDDLVGTGEFLFAPDIVPDEVYAPSISDYINNQENSFNFLPGYIPHESVYLGDTMRISEGTKVSAGGSNQENDKKLLNLEEGEVEVIKNEQDVTDSEYDGIKTPNATVISVQTHYWVSYDKKKNQTAVVVYEGKVEVKTRDGRTTMVSPDGDEPGIVIVSQKLSPIKLAIAGLILVVVIGGAVLILKRKFTVKGSNKKKK